jgi:hypothetical protein
MATDGLWDTVPLDGVCRLSRTSGLKACAAALTGAAASRMQSAVRTAVPDDISVVIMDMMPNCLVSFLDVVAQSHHVPPCTAPAFPCRSAVTEAGEGSSPRCAAKTLAQVLSGMGLDAPHKGSAPPPEAARVPLMRAVRVLADVDMLSEATASPKQARRDPSHEAFRSDSAHSISGSDADKLRKACREIVRDGAGHPDDVQAVRAAAAAACKAAALEQPMSLPTDVGVPDAANPGSPLAGKVELDMNMQRLGRRWSRLGICLRPVLCRQ